MTPHAGRFDLLIKLIYTVLFSPMFDDLGQNVEKNRADCQNQRPVLEGHSIHHLSSQSSALNWPPVL